MAHKLSEFSLAQLSQLFTQIGLTLSERELFGCYQQAEIIQPNAGKKFWCTADAHRGIYLVLAGKARLLDSSDSLITSLEAGSIFGEVTLFTPEQFQPYAIRASINLKLCYLSYDCLQSLIATYPALRDRLYQQAVLRDLLLLCRQSSFFHNASVDKLMQILPLLEQHICRHNVSADVAESRLWLVRRGELVNSAQDKLTTGDIHFPKPSKDKTWQATVSTELYVLRDVHWQSALQYLPQLATTADAPQVAAVEPETRISLTEVAVDRKNQVKINQAYFPRPTVKVGQWWQRFTRRYPFFAQQSTADCGAACLVMIGRYWGKRFSVNRLRDIANVDRNGASLRGLAAAAESIGFITRPVKASLNKLAEQTLPAIAHWEGRHYVVVYEITPKQVVIGDPATGQKTLSSAAFKASWTGYTLLLQPTALLDQTKDTKQTWWQFIELIKPHTLVLLEVLIASLLLQVFGLITPLLTQLLLDRVVVQRSTLTLTAVGMGLLIFGLFRVAMIGLRQYLLDHTAHRIDLALIVGFIKHTFRLPLSFFESRYVGDIISRVQENYKIQQFLTGEALSIFLDLLTVFVYAGLMFWYSWQMALLVLVVVPPFFLLALIATPFFRRISKEIFNSLAEQNSYLIEALTGIRTIKSMAVEQTVRWHWEELLNKSVRTSFSGQVIDNSFLVFSSTIEALATTALLWFGAWQVIQNQLTIGQLVAFNMLLSNVINPFQRLTVLWNQLQEVVIAVERINDVIETQPEEDLQNQPRQLLPTLQGHIRFEQVTFRYHPESEVNTLENISFEVKPGETVALVGRSGSGKTTISKLVLGLYPPTEGKILIDGYDITSVALRSLRQQIGVVDQDTFLFGGTIWENISLGHPEASPEDIRQAAKLAGADQFIQELPMGYETKIGEGGGMLSGGQRQRIAIARAFLGNPHVLVLDEATSHLDAESERIIQNNLSTLLQGRTTIIIAHRLSTVRQANKILVLDRGVLVESGTHEELMTKRGQYFYLNQQQITGITS
ncbi:bacteriocin-processing peptidase [Gloeocapsa sp. PCC 7428]|uniref:peptidase domain-containing ABC transporter n=1 Tax=Gloeocapsa sp. PCC 7428 TaxID=1173026 RepID=UPI0002A616C2|nr:peptidase domain-containing ABC transporter [Gloeocapsa sp. PCC 7428]AFZ32033.1 bacteriocin-processing peptidase [Gloeocapsa sp. PCC 7428]